MNKGYIVNENDKEILLFDDTGNMNVMKKDLNNLNVINLENVIEVIQNKVDNIIDNLGLANSSILSSIYILIFSTIIGAFYGIGSIILLKNIARLVIPLVFGSVCTIVNIYAIIDIVKRTKKKKILKRKLKKNSDLMEYYEKELKNLKEKIKTSEEQKGIDISKYCVYEFKPELIEVDKYDYNNIDVFKKRVLKK